jgi:multiple sugar transport system substrate-binding protein
VPGGSGKSWGKSSGRGISVFAPAHAGSGAAVRSAAFPSPPPPHPATRARQRSKQLGFRGSESMTRPILTTYRLLAVCLLAVVLAACGDDGGDSGGGDLSGEVSFLVFGEPEELKAFRGVVSGFKKVEPGVRVKLIEASDREDLLARLSTSFAGGTPPDLFLLNYRFYGQFAARDVLEPIEERLNESDAFGEKDFYPQAMDAFRFDGKLICLPQNISSLVVYYNRDLFKQAKVPEPEPGWTWNDMVQKAIKLTRDTNGDGDIDQHGLGVEPSIIRIAPFVWSNGGELVDDEDAPTRFTLDTPEATEAMQRFFDLRREHLVIPSEQEVEAEDDETRFQNGREAMVLSSRRATPAFRTITAFDWDIAPLPKHDEQAGILHSDAYCMTKASDNKDAAWAFMEFALGPEGQRITARSGRTVPSLKAVAQSDAFLDPSLKPAHSEVFLDTIPVIQRVPTISTWPEIEDASEGILEQGLYRGVPAEVVARRLVETTAPIFERAED